jgi:Uma2 family endonuclease
MSTVPTRRLTPQEYLALERNAECRNEYFAGELFAMAGASREHILIAGNVLTMCNLQFRGRECEAYQSDMRVKVLATGLYTYPDVSVVCGHPQFEDAKVDTLLNPKVIFEVLSESTEGYDRGKKFEHYRTIPSLAEYVLIAQEAPHVEVHTRQDDGRWLLWETNDLNHVVQLQSIACSMKMSEVYARVFPRSDAGGH